jgi:hypothetical protein
VSHVDLAHRTPTDTPKTKSLDEAEAESVDEAVRVADFSGMLASLPLQDVVLAEDTPMASVEPAPEVVEPTLPTIELLDATTTLAQTEAARPATPEETEEATGLLLSLEFDLSTLAEAEVLPSDLTGPARNEAPFTDADEAGSRPPSVSEWTPTDAETPPEGLLTSSDMFALENLEDPIPPEHLTLELEPPVLPADLASGVLEDAPQTPLPAVTEIPELLTSASTEPGLPVGEAVSFEDLDDITLPDHLTLELDSSDMASEVSSIILDNLQPENPPGDIQSRIPPHDDQADDEPELLLDLDGLELGDDEPA